MLQGQEDTLFLYVHATDDFFHNLFNLFIELFGLKNVREE